MEPLQPIASRQESEAWIDVVDGQVTWRGNAIGRFHLSDKGYPRFHSGAHRGQYVHRVIAALTLGLASSREIEVAWDIHHRDNDKLNFAPHNLALIDHRQHGFISALQSWYIRHVVEPQRKLFFDEVNGLDAQLDEDAVVDVSFDVGEATQW